MRGVAASRPRATSLLIRPHSQRSASRGAPSRPTDVLSCPHRCLLPLAAARGRRRRPCRPHLSVRAGPAPGLLLNAGARPSRLLCAARGWSSLQQERFYLCSLRLCPAQHAKQTLCTCSQTASVRRWAFSKRRAAGLLVASKILAQRVFHAWLGKAGSLAFPPHLCLVPPELSREQTQARTTKPRQTADRSPARRGDIQQPHDASRPASLIFFRHAAFANEKAQHNSKALPRRARAQRRPQRARSAPRVV